MLDRTRITSTDYRHPYRPRPVAWANRTFTPLTSFGLSADLTPAGLMSAAQRGNRLDDFGDRSFVAPMERLLAAVEAEARLNPIGRLITRKRLVSVLGNRLRLQKIMGDNPEIARQDVAPILLVTGLQRSGTTMLHRLLGSDPDTRALTAWEALNPAPFLPWRPGDSNVQRRGLAWLGERALAYLSPDFFAVHPAEADAPEEDSILLDFSFLSPVAEATLRVPNYRDWLIKQDFTRAYQELALWLRLLQWQRPTVRWVLKTPVHLEHLDLLVALLPGLRIVQLHRDPQTTVASFASMLAHARGVFSDAINPEEVGREALAYQARLLRQAQRQRQDPRVNRAVLDLSYKRLIADPGRALERIYRHAGLELSARRRRGMLGGLKRNRQHRFGKHRYRLDDFGLGSAELAETFSSYHAWRRTLLINSDS